MDIPEIKEGEDFAMRPQTPEEKQAYNEADVPEYKIKISLSETDMDRLKKQVKEEFEAIENEREESGIVNKWEQLDRQYDGQLAKINNLDFQIDVRESKIKVDAVVRALMDSFLPDSGDIIDVTPRPEASVKRGWEIAEKQQQFIDYAIDEEIKPELSLRKIAVSAVKKFVGIGKIIWALHTQNRRREEHWEGKLEPVGQMPNGQVMYDNEGLRNFLSMYPDAERLYPAQVKRLTQGKSIDIVVNYKEQVFNNPELQYVAVEDFYVRNACDYNRGLQTEHFVGEKKRYSYWELKKLEADGEFENVDKLFIDSKTEELSANAKTQEYEILEINTYFRLDEKDDEETKVKVWYSADKKVILSVIQYPYYGIDSDYIAFYVTANDKGFYGNADSVMFDLRDTHIAQDALISLMLQGIYIRNIVTPIVAAGSETEKLFLEHKFTSGSPIPVSDMLDGDIRKSLDFVQYPNMDLNGGLAMLEKTKRIGSDVSRVSDLTTGGESRLDPSAPATKTIALLQQSGQGIRDYIRLFKSSFDMFAGGIMQLYYQMSTEDRKYKISAKSKAVTGEDVFSSISREEMVVKTFVQSRASTFAFDKAQEAQKAMAAYQVVRNDPYLARQPQVLYKALINLMETFGGKWKTFATSDMKSPEAFNQELQGVAVEAMKTLLQQMQQQGQQPNMEQIMQQGTEAIGLSQAAVFNPQIAEAGQNV